MLIMILCATEIMVRDGHSYGDMVPHKMISGAKYIAGRPRPDNGTLPEFDSSDDAMIMIGFHAMMCTPDGALNHTILLTNATTDTWCNPRSTFDMLVAASPVYELLGIKNPLSKKEFPKETVLIDSCLGYHIRPGEHDMTEVEWNFWFDFTDNHLGCLLLSSNIIS